MPTYAKYTKNTGRNVACRDRNDAEGIHQQFQSGRDKMCIRDSVKTAAAVKKDGKKRRRHTDKSEAFTDMACRGYLTFQKNYTVYRS